VLSTIGKLTAWENPVHGRAAGKAGGAAGPLTEAVVRKGSGTFELTLPREPS
jgi:hypothetical protein